jgi:hypothetical protein
MTMRSSRARLGLLGVLATLLAGCAESTRIATENDGTEVSGQTLATTLQQRLAQLGVTGPTVNCGKTVIVNVGPEVSCTVSAAGATKTVKFQFKTLDGKVDLPTVKVS